jgi:hypothetical protein
MPRVSVVVPAFNVERYLAQAMRCVLAQTYQDLELIVVDDGSTDGSRALAESFDDPRVRVISQANRGLAGARNTGIRAARGEFVAFLDADDLWRADKLACHVRHLDARPEVGVSICQSAFIAEDGEPMNYLQAPRLTGLEARDIFLRNPVGNGSAPVIRAATLRDIAYLALDGRPGEYSYFDESFRRTEDVECWMRIALTTHWRFEGLAEPLTLYRVNAGGLSADLDKQYASWECMVAKLEHYAPAFCRAHVAAARAYQLRYLARRAIRLGQAGTGLALLARALVGHPRMLVDEAARTLATLSAGLVCLVLPMRLYRRLESAAMRVAAARSAASRVTSAAARGA